MNTTTTQIWNRLTGREETATANKAEALVRNGHADYVGAGALPLDKSAPLGTPAGDGDGCVLVSPIYARGTVLKVSLAVGRRMVLNSMANYVDRDGLPLIDQEPEILAQSGPAAEPGAVSKLRRMAGRVMGTR